MALGVDTLKILIEADGSGLNSQLRRSGDDIVRFVNQMNRQEVNWQGILSRTISPAVISGVAALFALEIEQMLNFQGALSTAAAQSTDAFGQNAAGVTQAAVNISNATGVSAGDVATAMGIAAKSFSDVSIQTLIANSSAELAQMGFGNLTDIATELTNVLQAWGVQTLPQATDAINAMVNGVANGKVSFQDLAGVLSDTGPELSAKTNIQDTTAALEAFSKQSGQTAQTAMSSFKAIADAAGNPLNTMNFLVGNISDTIKKGGIEAAFKDVGTYLDHAGAAAVTLGQQMGLSQQDVNSFISTADKGFQQLDADYAKLKTDQETLNERFKQFSDSNVWIQLQKFFQSIANLFTGDLENFFNTLFGKLNGNITTTPFAPGVPNGINFSGIGNSNAPTPTSGGNVQSQTNNYFYGPLAPNMFSPLNAASSSPNGANASSLKVQQNG